MSQQDFSARTDWSLPFLVQDTGTGARNAKACAYLSYAPRKRLLVSDGSAALRQIFDTLCQRLEFMCATLEAENAYNIFKSLNSTGVPLGQSDLIRNFIFMHVAPDDHDEFDREFWWPLEACFASHDGALDEERFSRFFRDYLMSAGKYIPLKETFESFEARFEATDFSPKDLASELGVCAGDYAIISGQHSDQDKRVTAALAGLNVLDSSTTYPLLLALFERRRREMLNPEQLAFCIDILRGFILRRFICGETSRGYGQMFVRALARDQGDPAKTLESYLLDRGWPHDHRFETAFVQFPLYERGYTREVLETLERARGHKEPAGLEGAQVEHVLPQTLNDAWMEDLGAEADAIHAQWLHCPGNLTLSGYNTELWNHPFSKKRERYAQSNIVLTRELASYDHWTDQEIQARGGQLATEAVRIWKGPQEPFVRAESETDEEGPGRFELRRRFWSGLNDYLVAEHPDLPHFDIRPSSTIRLPSGIHHIGFELRFSLRHEHVGIDVWFWRAASFPIWQAIMIEPALWNALIGADWMFELVEEQSRGRMYLIHPLLDPRNESSWSEVYSWFGQKLSRLYEKMGPRLREEMDRHTMMN